MTTTISDQLPRDAWIIIEQPGYEPVASAGGGPRAQEALEYKPVPRLDPMPAGDPRLQRASSRW